MTALALPSTAEFSTVVVGAGPGGLVTALRAARAPGTVLIVDQGGDIDTRVAARSTGADEKTTITSGFGGAGLFSDGKLCLSPHIGSLIANRFPAEQVVARQTAIDELLRGRHEAPLHGADQEAAARLSEQAQAAGLRYLHYGVRHLGTDQLTHMGSTLRKTVAKVARIQCEARCTRVARSTAPGFRWEVTVVSTGRKEPVTIHCDQVVLAPGKVGAAWLRGIGEDLGLQRKPAQPKLGFRLEGPRDFLSPLLEVANDPKVIWKADDQGAEVRTHCVCFGGDVVPAAYQDLVLVGGHSTSEHGHDRTNTAVLATAGRRLGLTAPQARDIVARINAATGGRVLAQTLADFLAGRPTTAAVPAAANGFVPSIPDAAVGDLTRYLPVEIVELLRAYLERLAVLCPTVLSPHNMLYGPAVERWADRFEVDNTMQASGHPGLYLVGDGPGLTGGIIGAADSGWLAGDAIAASLQHATS